jgi:hypothetical protein
MRLACSIQPRAVCVALIVNSFVTFVAVGIAAWLAMRPERECPTVRIVEVGPSVLVQTPPPAPQWATSVRSFSSEYSTSSWSAQQALGAPNVFPRSGDEAHAWASSDADAVSEFIEVGFAQPQHAAALEIYETFNPGAITSVELVTEQGTRISLARRELRWSGGAAVSTFGNSCTAERIIAARITVASGKVAGWNEVDAVGLLPCQ